MEELTYKAQIAVIKVLTEILNADNIVREKELKYLNDVMLSFGLNYENESDVNSITSIQAISIIKELPIDQKCEIAQMMGKMIIVDEDINYNEVKLYNTFCESCGIESNFNIEDYPEYSISGPFFNPEDLMNNHNLNNTP